MPAVNLEQALDLFHPAPLRGSELDLYYVERPGSPLDRLALRLRTKRRPLKFLFTGHRASGKTTTLNRLTEKLSERFFVIHFSVLDTLNAYDVHYADLLLVMGTQLLVCATDEKLFPKGVKALVREDLLNDVLRWLQARIEGLQFVPPSPTVSLNAKVNLLAVQLESKISTETQTRTQLRDRIELHLSELLDRINYVVDEVRRKGQRSVLFVVEDIDKLDLDNARKLFLEHARSLTAPKTFTIYTFPIALCYSHDFTQIVTSFDGRYILPNVKLREQDGTRCAEGQRTLEQIFHRRLQSDLITPEALQALIEASGGLVGTLIRLGELSAEHALVDRKTVIDLDSAEHAIAEVRADFKALLRPQDYVVLKQKRRDKNLVSEPGIRDVLYNGSLLEYHNHEPWCDVHPAVLPLLGEEVSE
jgi:hypothetical protein